METSDVVIKAKYLKTLRRFRIQTRNLTMDGLKESIRSLFSLPPERQLVLTYIDEDGDTVTLVDAVDLQDIVKQRLNPLRITVKLLSAEKSITRRSAVNINAEKGKEKTSKEELGDCSFKLPNTASLGNNITTTATPIPVAEGAFGNATSKLAAPLPPPPPPPPPPRTPPVAVHRGVGCDGCGIYPITGPRFQSKVKVNYDLCSRCCSRNLTDYIRMDHPHSFDMKSSTSIPSCFGSQNQSQPAPQPKPPIVLDSRLIMHVNVEDGTVIAPSTPFTKIWRMRNTGTVKWGKNTQLIWVGGSTLGNKFRVQLQVPSSGVLLDQELDISVDFTSPSRPGRYTSNWRMISSGGQTFGQRIWVDIEVQEKTPLKRNITLDLNELPVDGSSVHTDSVDGSSVHTDSVDGSSVHTDSSQTDDAKKTVGVEKTLDSSQTDDAKKTVEIENSSDSLQTDDAERTVEIEKTLDSSSQTDDAEKTVEIEKTLDLQPYLSGSTPVDLRPYAPLPTPVLHWFDSPYPISPPPAALSDSECETELGDDEAEETLHPDLDVTGLKNEEQNKEVFKKNEYDLEKPVDHLCDEDDDDGWDPMLAELEEMGFREADVNKTVLKENNGSIRGAVMDLIAQEKLD